MPPEHPTRRDLLRCAGLAAAAAMLPRDAATAVATASAPRIAKPHIVILVADDLGYGDVGFNGGKGIATPHLDRLAADGVRLKRFYACPMCSPTRAGLMTGRYPLRFGLMRAVIPPWRKYGMPPKEHTIAEMLAPAGYQRRAAVGKWHLGHSRRAWLPGNQGFTHFYGHYNGAIDYFTHQREDQLDWHKNLATCHDKGYSTGLIAKAAAQFIREHPTTGDGADRPLLLYVPFNAPHSPFQAEQEDLNKYAGVKDKRRRTYCAMVHAMDRGIGRILKALDDKGFTENTFVLFFSDNGGVRSVASNRPLRGGKLTMYEGGIRVAAAARWPAGGIKGGRVVAGRMGYIDVYPTLKRLAGVTADDPNPTDGVSVLDVLRGRAAAPDREWFSFLHQNGPAEHVSVNTDDWKLIVHGPSVLDKVPPKKRKLELYDMRRDDRETTNLADKHPNVVKRLMARLREFRSWKLAGGVEQYGVGRRGFKAPKDWLITK